MPPLREVERFLAAAERAISLIDRCRPRNAASEVARLVEALGRGEAMLPRFEYDPPPDLGSVARALEVLADKRAWSSPIERLYGDRAGELWLEARAAEAIGTAQFESRARARFALVDTVEGASARAWAEAWAETPLPSQEPLVRSDDELDTRSLVSAVRREIGAHRLPVRVVSTTRLVSAAAAADGVVYVRAASWHTEKEGRRIALHEVAGHVLPRVRARAETYGILRVGTRGSAEDEEGRALLLEKRGGYFGAARRRELSFRHLAACSVRAGADFGESARMLRERGASDQDAVTTALRVHRGGGLGREIVYLPALARVEHAFTSRPELETWFERGRVSAAAAALLATRWPSEGPYPRASAHEGLRSYQLKR